MKRGPIIVVGSSNTDMIIRLKRIPRPGETILGGDFATAAGGKGANQAVSAARCGGKVSFVARIGQDVFGDSAVTGFIRDRIDINRIFRDKVAPSGVALIFVAKDGENCIAVAGGSNGRLSPADIEAASNEFEDAKIVIMQLESPIETVRAAATLGARAGACVILNPAPARRLPGGLLRNVSIITPNESEAELLTGVKVKSDASAAKASVILRSRGVKTVVITLGARGAFVATEEGASRVPGFEVKAVDTTAAGDVFSGALAVALAEARSLFESVRFANAAAALSVTRAGAQPSIPFREEVDRFLELHHLKTR
jgi:ribokinase